MLYTVVGHVCQDVVPEGRVLGGTATYASLTARALGWSVSVVTRIQRSIELSLLDGVDCVRLPSDATTIFENIYTAGGRLQYVHSVADPIRAADIPPRARRADVLHLAPIADEVGGDVIEAFPGALVGVTPQGWMRQWDAAGLVSPREWISAESILDRVDAVVLSIDDVAGDWAQIERWAAATRILVVTQSRDGCAVYRDGRPARLPAPEAAELDPVGAGDIFAAAFFMRLRETGDALAAARLANCIGARSVTRRRLDAVPTAAEARACRESSRL